MTKYEKVMPLIKGLLDSEWERILRPVLMKRLSLYLKEIEDSEKDKIGPPTYYVRHPDDTYSIADPQP